MNTTIFDQISHDDFLRMTLEAFKRQGYAIELSQVADADAVLIAKNGARIGMLCKKYRSAFIGRPVIQQFHGAMLRLNCTEGYLVSTTECSPEAADFATGKGIVLFNRERTTELLRTAFGEEFIRSGTIPRWGKTAATDPPAARRTNVVASYEKTAAPGPAGVSGTARAPEPRPAAKPEQAAQTEHAPSTEAAGERLPDETQNEESTGPAGTPEAAPSDKMTTIVCWECNKQLQVPYDQGVVMVTCPECGMKRIYQSPVNSDGELLTTTVITCRSCKQNLNVPINRGQLKVRCPNCRAAWVYTP